MNSYFPSISKCLDRLGLLRQVGVLAICDFAMVHKGLKIRPIPNSVGWINVYHLNFPRHSLFFKERIHNEQGVTGDQSVRPSLRMFVKLDCFSDWRIVLLVFTIAE